LFCDEYAKKLDNTWVKGAINRDEGDKDNQKGTYEQYLTRVQFTAQEMEQKEKEGLKLGPAVWGRPKIEGRMFCEQYRIQLHIIEIQESGEVLGYLVNANGEQEDVNPTIDYNDPQILHIVNYRNHYVPLLDTIKTNLLQQPMMQCNSNKDSRKNSAFFKLPTENTNDITSNMSHTPDTFFKKAKTEKNFHESMSTHIEHLSNKELHVVNKKNHKVIFEKYAINEPQSSGHFTSNDINFIPILPSFLIRDIKVKNEKNETLSGQKRSSYQGFKKGAALQAAEQGSIYQTASNRP
jgi:hypothetical protein